MKRYQSINQKTVVKAFLLFVISFFLSKAIAFGQGSEAYVLNPSSMKYIGYFVATGGNQFALKSNISAINGMRVPQFGMSAGMVMANVKGAFKSHVGLAYASESLPYSFDGLEIGVSRSLYLLRLKSTKFHTVEPYLVADVTGQRISFFGSYLNDPEQPQNLSTSREKLLGRVTSIKTSIGLGAEYQLIGAKNQFLNFFAEASVGAAFPYHASNRNFDGTSISNPVSLQVGVSFGKIKSK